MGTDSALRLVTPEYRANQLMDRMNHRSYPRITTAMLGPSAMSDYSVAVTYTTLKRLLVEIRRDHLQFKNRIRVGFRDGKQAALYLDDYYLEQVGLTPRDIDYLARDIAQQLGNFINGPKVETDQEQHD